jgi:glutamate:Na+ symporter, ESS family
LIPLLICFSILGISYLLKHKSKFLRNFRIPPSLIGGIIFLLLFTIFPEMKSSENYNTWKEWPTITISLVFASLFLEIREKKSKKTKFAEVVLQTMYVYFAIFGQLLVGLVSTILIFAPIFDVPIAFASVLENGFAGGHGTAVAMKKVYFDNGLAAGTDYALFSATIGIVYGIFGGIFLVSRARGKSYAHFQNEETLTGINLHKLFINLGMIFTAVLLGHLLKDYLERLKPEIPNLPLFVYSLFISVIFRSILVNLKKTHYLDNSIIAFFSGFFMEILIFSAVATMNLNLINEAIFPLMLLFFLGFLWNLFCHLILSKNLLPKAYSFELSLLNFGMLNGTTAIGLMLLKMMDPDLKTNAVKTYAESAPFTSIFVGGGILSFAFPYLINYYGGFIVCSILILGMVVFFFSGRIIKNKLEFKEGNLE